MNVLFFGIHPDDIEMGCGGTVAVCCDRGDSVVMVDLTRGESASNGTPAERAEEAMAAAEILGCNGRENLALPDAGIASEDAEQLAAVTAAIRAHRPDVVIVPYADDPHPDHASGAVLIDRSLYLAGIHGYRPDAGEAWKVRDILVYSGRRMVTPAVVVDVTSVVERKRKAIAAHKSQFGRTADSAETPLNQPGFMSAVEARDRLVGHAIGVQFGEAFAVREPVALRDLSVFGGTD